MTPHARRDNIHMKGGVKYMTKYERVRFTFRLPDSLMSKLKDEAKSKNVSVNALILKILWEWLEKNNN